MVFGELTEYQKRRFQQMKRCPICGRPIDVGESFQVVKVRRSKAIYYTFIHDTCIINRDLYAEFERGDSYATKEN